AGFRYDWRPPYLLGGIRAGSGSRQNSSAPGGRIKALRDQQAREGFQKEGKETKEAFQVAKCLFCAKCEAASFPEGASSGQAFLYFSPEGLVEPAAIQLTNGKETTWTLIVNPLTGRMDLVDRAVSLRDLKE